MKSVGFKRFFFCLKGIFPMWFSHIQNFEIIKMHCNLLNLSENILGKQDYNAFIRGYSARVYRNTSLDSLNTEPVVGKMKL